MFGDTPLSPESELADASAYLAQALHEDPGALLIGLRGQTPAAAGITHDQWGLTQIPTTTGLSFQPVFKSAWVAPVQVPVVDPCLAVILDYLATWLVTDANSSAAWSAVSPTPGGPSPAIVRLFAHNPKDEVFSKAYLPALFLWRGGPEQIQQGYIADDYMMETTPMKGLWVFPVTSQSNQRVRSNVAHVLGKLIGAGIERGRTPSWVQPDDLDPLARTQGSLFYSYAGFAEFELTSWRPNELVLMPDDKGSEPDRFFAVELTFKLVEQYQYGLGRTPPYAPTSGGLSVLNPTTGLVVDQAVLQAANT